MVAIYREVTVRHYIHGHSVDKIAQDLGIPRGTVLSRLSKAREQVKNISHAAACASRLCLENPQTFEKV